MLGKGTILKNQASFITLINIASRQRGKLINAVASGDSDEDN